MIYFHRYDFTFLLMKNKISFFLLLISIFIFSQENRFIYQVTYKKNNTSYSQYFNLDIKEMSSFFYETDRDSENKEDIGTELIIKKD